VTSEAITSTSGENKCERGTNPPIILINLQVKTLTFRAETLNCCWEFVIGFRGRRRGVWVSEGDTLVDRVWTSEPTA